MTHRPPALLLFTAVLLLGALTACPIPGGGDDDDSQGAETIETVCDQVFECGGWGWLDEDECVEGFLDNSDYATDCADAAGYLGCMPDCMDLDCETFATCEGDCWAASCE